MSKADTQRYLAELQSRFGTMLHTPLDRSTGTLRAQLGLYPRELCRDVSPSARGSERERLAVYNRQYWFRHFAALQREYLLSAGLLGMWAFNELASRYLLAAPPQHYDLQRIAPGFLAFLQQLGETSHSGVPMTALIEAARIDHAISRVFLAPRTIAFDPASVGPAALLTLRLQPAEHVAIIEEHRPLVELRRRVQRETVESRLALPDELEAPQHWVILRKDLGHAFGRIPALAYRLYTLLASCPIGDTLAQLEAACTAEERAGLPAQVQRWLQDGVRAGFWEGAV